MENESIKTVTETLTASLDNTQKTATNTEDLVVQVLAMSDKIMHELTTISILRNDDLDITEKLALLRQENAEYDLRQERCTDRVVRLQDSLTQNVGKASKWWGDNWFWVVSAGVVVTLFKPLWQETIFHTS